MPAKDYRTRVSTVAVKGRYPTSGKIHVDYRNIDGQMYGATVIGPGTSSGLKLNLDGHAITTIVDNVAAATGLKQTGVYFLRHQ